MVNILKENGGQFSEKAQTEMMEAESMSDFDDMKSMQSRESLASGFKKLNNNIPEV